MDFYEKFEMRLSDFSFYKDLICYPKRMLRKNPVIRLTNYFLFGILGGGLLAWMLSSLDKEDVQIPPTISRSETVESQRKQGGVMSAEALNSTSSDTDGDGIPNTWELSHSLDPNDPTDASSDFDFDGLTALQEFQHGTSPLGVWVEEGLDLGGVLKAGSRQYLKFTASGYILVSGTLKDTSSGSGRSGILWHRDTGPVEIAKPSGSSLYLWDVNEYGEVVGGYIPPGGGLQRAFRWSAKDGFQEIAPPSSMTGIVLGYRINDLGDVLLQSVSSAPIVSAVVSENGETITELASDLDQPRLLCLNNYREMLGVYLSPADGTPKAFLRLPGLSDFDTSLASSYPNLFDEDTAVSLFTAQMNDFGEFGCDYEVEGPAWNPIIDSYFFDGDFHSFRQADDKRVQLLGLNNRPQLLFSVRTSVGGSYNLSSSYRFSSGGQIAPVSSFHDNSASTQPPNYSKINDNGVILGYRGYSRHPFLLRLDQDADADGLSDDWETYYGFNPNSALDANQDEDGDGYTNLAEFRLKRNPTVVEVPSATTGQVPDLRPGIDTDGDGMPNVWEVHHGLNWEDPADAAYDPDRDGFTNLEEFKLGTDPQGAPAFQVLSLPDHYQNAGGSLSLMADDETGYFGTFVAGPSESEVFQWTPQDLTPGSVKPESLTLHSTTQYGEWPASLSAHASGVFGGSLRRSSTSHVSIPAYWDAQGVHRFDSFGLTSGSIQAISNDGRFVCGTRQINSIHQIFVHDRQLGTTRPVSLGNLRALGWGNFTIHPSGYLLAPVRNVGHASESAIFKKTTSGTWVLDTYLPGSISTQTYMSQKSDVTVAGTMRPSGTKAHLFTWSPSQGYRNVGRPDGGSEAYVRAMSPSGIFAGHTRVLDQSTGELVNRAFLSRFNTDSGDVTFDFLATPAGLSSEVRSLNDQGEVLGFVKDGYTSTDGIWRGLSSFYALDDIIKSPEKEIFHTYVSKINERGEILARGIVDDVYTSFVLQPVTDTDADGIPDRYENSFGFDPFSQDDGILDFDGDGLSNRDEFKHNTDPVLPDTDADGMPDSWEVEWGLDARDPSNANQDPDRDRVSNLREYEIGTVPTGLYQMSHLELPALPSQSATLVSKVPDQDSYLINLNASDLPRRPVIVSSGSAGGPPTLTHFQPLTVGKQASAIKLTENGFIIGYSYTPNHRRRIVLWETDYPNQKPRPLLYGVGDGYQSIIDISENGYWILARWQKFDGSYTVGVLNNSEPWDGVTISSDYNDFGDQLAAGESINWTRINDRGEVLGIRSGPGSQANEDSFNIVTRASSDAFGAASGIVNLLQTPITAPSESWPWMQINGNVNDRSYAVSLEEYPSYSGLGKDSRTHFVVHDLGEYGNFVPSPTANLLDLPDSPSFRVIDTNRAGDLLAQQFSYGYLNRGQGMIRIDALRIDDPSTASAASVSALPTLHELLGTSDCRPQFVDEQGLIAGLIVNSDRSVRIWSMIEVADQDENGLNDDWQKAYQDWTGNNSPVNGLSLDSQTGMMLAQLSSTSHPSGGEIIQSGNWVGKVLERTLDEIFEALAPRLVGQKIFHSFTSVVRSDSSVDSWHTGFILGNVADPNRFWGHKTTNPPIASLHKNLVDHPYVYDENGNILSSDRLRFSPRNGLPYNHQFLDSRFFNSRGVGVNGDSRTIFLEKSALQYQLPIKSLEKQQYSALLLVYKRKKGEEDIFLDESRLIEFTVEKDARKSEVVEILPDLKNLKEDSNAKYALIYDLLPVEVKEVSFAGAKYHELKKDDVSVTYSAPHWVDKDGNGNPTDTANGEKDYSVAYTRNTKPSIGAKFSIQGLPNNLAIKLRAKGSDGIEIPETAAQINGNDVILPVTASSTNWPNTIKFYDRADANKAFKLDWEIKVGDSDWAQVASTKHQVYLTLNDPVTAMRQETLFYLSAKNADGVAQEAAVTTSIWNEFTDLDVRRIDGTQLTYYKSFQCNNVETESLLKNGDGQCGSWAKFFIDLRKVHGIDVPNEYVVFRPSADDGFLVKNWNFNGAGTSGVAGYPYLNIPDAPFPSANSYSWKFAEVTDQNGIPGQGNPNPASLFGNHQVVIDGQYYDPSYGKKFASLKDIDDNAIDGYFRVVPAAINEPDFNLDLNGDGDKIDMGVQINVFLIRKNPAGMDLIEQKINY